MPLEPHTTVVAAVLYRAFRMVQSETAQLIESLEKGQLSVSGVAALNSFPVEISYEGVKYSFKVTRSSIDSFVLEINGQQIPTKARYCRAFKARDV